MAPTGRPAYLTGARIRPRPASLSNATNDCFYTVLDTLTETRYTGP